MAATEPTKEEAASFRWGGQRARPRKGIEKITKKKETYLKPPGSCNSKWPDVSIAVDIECCEDSTIAILDTTSQVQISDCIDCRIIVGPCTGSVFLLDCTRCTVSLAAKQVRLRDCFDCTFRTYVPTREGIVIETSKDVRFGAWDVAYSGLNKQFAATAWDAHACHWDKVYDFSPPAEKGAKNYTLLPTNVGLLEEQGLSRWSDVTCAPEGLCSGTVSETRCAFPTVTGCECPCLSADGTAYLAQHGMAAMAQKAAPASQDGVSGYAAMFGPKPTQPEKRPADGACGYAAKFSRSTSETYTAFTAEAHRTGISPGDVIIMDAPTPPPPVEPGLLQKIVDWFSSWLRK